MLDVYYPDDLKRILRSLASAGRDNGPAYLRAIDDVALAVGVDPFAPTPKPMTLGDIARRHAPWHMAALGE